MSRRIIFIFFLFFAIVFFDACKKPGPAIVVVTVLNDSSIAVPNANVRVYSRPNNSIIDVSNTTDATGHASFKFDTDYVLNIHCEKEINGDKEQGNAVVEIHPDKTTEKTVKIK